jgi:hypothetical protein
MAEASEDGTNPFGLDHIKRAVFPISTHPSVCYGIDLAKKHDFTVITGLDRFGNISHFDRFQKDWRQTTETILSLTPGMITIDSTGIGDAIAEPIARIREVEMVVYTSRTKQQFWRGYLMHSRTGMLR